MDFYNTNQDFREYVERYCTYTNEVVKYNDCYYLCLKRNPLIEKAKEIKESWISELEEKLEKAKSIEF